MFFHPFKQSERYVYLIQQIEKNSDGLKELKLLRIL